MVSCVRKMFYESKPFEVSLIVFCMARALSCPEVRGVKISVCLDSNDLYNLPL
jgi:hypothetical protein